MAIIQCTVNHASMLFTRKRLYFLFDTKDSFERKGVWDDAGMSSVWFVGPMSWSYEHNERKEPYHPFPEWSNNAVGAYRTEIWVRLMQRLKQKQQLGSTLQSK